MHLELQMMAEKKDLLELFDRSRERKKSFDKNIFKECLETINHLKTKYEEKCEECNRLETSLDVARNKIITLYHQNDEIMGKYNALLKNDRSNDIIDSEKQTETVDETSNVSKPLESSLREANKDTPSLLNSELTPESQNEDGTLVESQISSSNICVESNRNLTGKKRKRWTYPYNEASVSKRRKSNVSSNSSFTSSVPVLLSKELPFVSETPCSEDVGYESQLPDTQSAKDNLNSLSKELPFVSEPLCSEDVGLGYESQLPDTQSAKDSLNSLSKELPFVSEPPCSEDVGYESQLPDTQSAKDNLNSQSQPAVNVEAGELIAYENISVVISDSFQSNDVSTSSICCEICGRFFARKGNLSQHRKTHGPKQFKCSLCDESFRFRYQLTKHSSKPCSRKIFKCSICNAFFGYMATKRRHEKIFHTEYSKYWCSFCNVAFLSKEGLSEHLKKDHSKKTLWKFNDESSQSTQFSV